MSGRQVRQPAFLVPNLARNHGLNGVEVEISLEAIETLLLRSSTWLSIRYGAGRHREEQQPHKTRLFIVLAQWRIGAP